jgi:DNA primase catalytic subunit
MEAQGANEERIRKITHLYYSRKDIQKAIFSFSGNREVVPRYFEGFGKRPDSFQYEGDIFELVRKGATSFHCSEELWKNPMKIFTGMTEKQLNEQRAGWDLLLDIDSKYLDYSKIMAEQIFKIFKFHGIKNFGVKFSGSKGFHVLIPWKAFPKAIYNTPTSEMFPEWPRIITKYIIEMTKKDLIEKITQLTKPNKYVKDFQASGEVMPDLILVSPRHLFRMPYSLHEKTTLASVVINPKDIRDFQPKDADPFKAEIREFTPDSEEGEASELLREALDWYKTQNPEESGKTGKSDRVFQQIVLKEISEKNFPPSIIKILQGIKGDGRKRALFVILNFFRSIGIDRKDVESRLAEWNSKNELPLKEGYIKSQLIASYRGKPMPPPNFDKDYYRALGIVPTDEEKRYKNPSNYMIKKSLRENNQDEKRPRSKDNFKNKN